MARDLKEAVKMFEAIRDDLPSFYDTVLRRVGSHYLGLVIPLTPVEENYQYKMGDKRIQVSGGALRRGWIGEVKAGNSPSPSEIEDYVKKLGTGGNKITLANSVYYAMYVNYGHLQKPGRFVPAIGKRLKKHWVDGIYFKEEAENEINPYLPEIYDEVLKEYYKKWSKE